LQLQEVKKNRVYETIVTQVQDLIVRGELKTGDRLPPERDLVASFGVSRASVREAICVLESMGLVESRAGSGTYVTTASVENLIQPLALTILQEQDSIREIFEVRRLIEPHLAGLAAERAPEGERQELRAIVGRHGQMVDRGETGAEADGEFHLAIARAARNAVFLRLIFGVHDLLGKSRDSRFQTGGRPKQSLNGHLEVLAAIERGDSPGARDAMNAHLATVEKFVWKNMRKETSVAGGQIGRAGAPPARAASETRAGTNGGRTQGGGVEPRAKRKG
jgi:GntR family transcriptional repressor for pyruvate dehydrogenase complex